MTRKIGNNAVLIEQESDARCEMCGVVDELRPYGPKGERVCFDCMMKDDEAARRQFTALFKDVNDG